MRSPGKTIARLVSLVLPRRRRAQRSHASLEEDGGQPDLSLGSRDEFQRPPPTLDTLNADIIRLIALEIRERRDIASLQALASCSRTLRAVTAPVLFNYSKALAPINPPILVRDLARYLRFSCRMDDVADVECFALMLNDFPNIAEITFTSSSLTPWNILKYCLLHPSITSIVYRNSRTFAIEEPPTGDELACTPIPLANFAYVETAWREIWQQLRGVRPVVQFTREAKWLAALIPNMAETIQHLDIPMETAPIPRMVEISWPKLLTLTIRGRYLSEAQAESLPAFLSTLPHLQKLSVSIFRRKPLVRPPILGQVPSPSTVLAGLRSLTVAYPDPADDIFSVDTTRLTHLSLRDWPRYYYNLSYDRWYWTGWNRPILTSAECLSILKRMDMPDLSSLELVYLADANGSDDDLLVYVTDTYPHLAHLELHRYRANREEVVDHAHIANLLTAASSLRTCRLNLDFHDDHGLYCSANLVDIRARYWTAFREVRGPEIIKIMESCPYLEYVELLYHGPDASRWPRFLSSRYPEPRFMDSTAMELRDSEPLPRRGH